MRDMRNNKYYNEYKFYTKSMIEFELEIMNDYEDYKNYKQEPLSDEWYKEKETLIEIYYNTTKMRWVKNYIIQLPKLIRYTIGNWIVDINYIVKKFNNKTKSNISDLPF